MPSKSFPSLGLSMLVLAANVAEARPKQAPVRLAEKSVTPQRYNGVHFSLRGVVYGLFEVGVERVFHPYISVRLTTRMKITYEFYSGRGGAGAGLRPYFFVWGSAPTGL